MIQNNMFLQRCPRESVYKNTSTLKLVTATNIGDRNKMRFVSYLVNNTTINIHLSPHFDLES